MREHWAGAFAHPRCDAESLGLTAVSQNRLVIIRLSSQRVRGNGVCAMRC